MSYEENTPLWYVIHTNPKQEARADSNLKAWGVETFFPKVRERRYSNMTGEPSFIIKPLFPRYIFAKFKVCDLYHRVRYTRGVHSLVSLTEGPTAVDEEIVAAIQARINREGLVRLEEEFEAGDEVEIKTGPFKDFTGIFERELQDHERVRILLQTVSYQAHIIVERQLINKKAAAACAAQTDLSACPAATAHPYHT